MKHHTQGSCHDLQTLLRNLEALLLDPSDGHQLVFNPSYAPRFELSLVSLIVFASRYLAQQKNDKVPSQQFRVADPQPVTTLVVPADDSVLYG